MARNLKIVLRYDGTDFAGWQVQPNQRTVQGELERALAQVAGERVAVQGAGRTDAGVHALGQVASCLWPKDGDLNVLHRSLAKMLGPDVLVLGVEEAAPDFEAGFSAQSKRYAYAFTTARFSDPFTVRYAWRVPHDLDLARLDRICARYVGTHDFAGFQCAGASVKTTVRTIHRVCRLPGGFVQTIDDSTCWRMEFFGEGFLYKMVRNLMGAAVDVARGALPEERIDELLASKGPYRGYTAPACGLALVEVGY